MPDTNTTLTTNDIYICREFPTFFDDKKAWTRVSDNGTISVWQAKDLAWLYMPVGMVGRTKDLTDKIISKGATVTVERIPNDFPGRPGACRVDILEPSLSEQSI